jgi:hypothetical protein
MSMAAWHEESRWKAFSSNDGRHDEHHLRTYFMAGIYRRAGAAGTNGLHELRTPVTASCGIEERNPNDWDISVHQ